MLVANISCSWGFFSCSWNSYVSNVVNFINISAVFAYWSVCHVQAIGGTLSPVFNVDILDSEGSCVLKYSPNPEKCISPKNAHEDDVVGSSGWQAIAARIRQIRDEGIWNRVVILDTLLGNAAPGSDYDSDEDITKWCLIHGEVHATLLLKIVFTDHFWSILSHLAWSAMFAAWQFGLLLYNHTLFFSFY